MQWESIFFINSILLGTGLAMDAFSVSIANAMIESTMSRKRECAVASVYAFFQFVMPLTGWIFVHTITEKFSLFQRFIPYIALILLSYIGGKMLMETLASAKTKRVSHRLFLLVYETLFDCFLKNYFLEAINLQIGLPMLENFSSYSVMTFPVFMSVS